MRVPMRVLLAVTVLALALLAPQVGRAHYSPVHPFPIQQNEGLIVYVDVFTGHCCFYMTIEAAWSNVGQLCGYLHWVEFYYYNISSGAPNGGVMWAYNNNDTVKDMADTGVTYWEPGRYRVWINKWWCGGYANGNLAVTIEKHGVEYWSQAIKHKSMTTYYRP